MTPQTAVLMVEDNPRTYRLVARLLGGAGYQIRYARDGAEALECLRSDPLPQVILLDLLMPGMDGWEFRRRQRQDPKLADIPVMVLSGTPAEALQSDDLAGVSFLHKPFEAKHLLQEVRRLTTPAKTE